MVRAGRGKGGHDVVEFGGLHASEEFLHAPESSWNTPRVSPRARSLYTLGVGDGEVFQVDGFVPVDFDVFQGVADDGEVAQAQEVHFEQADSFAGGVGPAGDECPIGGTFHMGMQSRSGTEAMMTAQACTPACRTTPSSPRAVS